MKYFIVVGEASGDLHASRLMRALKKEDPGASFAFVGGPLMRAEGGLLVHKSEDLAIMGFIPVVKNLGYLSETGRKVRERMLDFGPDVVICVDFSGFCFRYILPFARDYLPLSKVVYYIPPKVWAWKKWRIPKLRELTDLVLCIFPFEVPFFKKEGVTKVGYVGNPTYETVTEYLSSGQSDNYGSDYVALLCGSRTGEVKTNLPTMVSVLRETGKRGILAAAPSVTDALIGEVLSPGDRALVKVVHGDTYGVVRGAKAALVTSGTATLETALLGTPQVVCYAVRGGAVANFVFDNFFPIPYISLVNLIAEQEVVPEMYGGLFTKKRIHKALMPLLSDTSERREMLLGYDLVRAKLSASGSSASLNAALAVGRLMGQ